MTSKDKKVRIILITGISCYLIGCVLGYFIWYKNGQFLHFLIIALIVAGGIGAILQYKNHKPAPYKKLLTVLFLFLFTGFAGLIFSLEKKRVNHILKDEATQQVTATVIAVDFRSTRTGKQPWAIINYTAKAKIIEQSFADTSRDLTIGRKFLIKYSINYPDMFRVVKALK